MKWLRALLGGTEPKPAADVRATVTREDGNVYALRISGTLNKPTLDRIQALAAGDIIRGVRNLKILVVLSDFQGWKRGDDWGDLNFFATHEAEIAKIAVVAEDRWHEQTMMFLGANRRTGDVRCFAPDLESQARAWLVA